MYPDSFQDKYVIDFGSMDINGNNRYLFKDCSYIGVDLGVGKNVSDISKAHEYIPLEPPDTVISTEMLEHDVHWKDSVTHMLNVMKCGGLLVITCATDGRGEHGTHEAHPSSSPYTQDYYHNVTLIEFREMLKPEFFIDYSLCKVGTDLQFYGIKK